MIGLGYLVGTVFCIQIMSSAYIRALGDKAFEVRNVEKADRYYRLAVKIDPQNWRADKGMGRLFNDQWYYTLDREEKLRFAMLKKEWYEKAYRHNPRDPEIVAGLGKTLLFLGRAFVAGEMEQGGWESEVGDQVSDVGGAALPSTQQPSFNNQQLQPKGLDLLREACRLRKFHDLYWWTLGVELRKAGLYEESLEVFHYAEKLKRTPSIHMNIQWLEKQMQKNEEQPPAQRSLRPGGRAEVIDLDGIFQSDSKTDTEKDSDLSALLDIMAN